MPRYLIIILFFSSIVFHAHAQELVFVNPTTNKSIHVQKGAMLMIEYRGYLKQMELTTNTLFQMNDSSIVIGKYHLLGPASDLRVIKTEDITGFRKVTVGTQVLKTILALGVTLGSYYAFSDNANLNSTERLVYSLGTGIVTTALLKIIFPTNRVKHKMKDGWKVIAL